MINMNPIEHNQSLSQSLFKELEGLKIRIAFAKIEEAEDQVYPDNYSLEKTEYSVEAQKRVLYKINQELSRQARKRFFSKTLPRGLQMLAGIVLLFFLSLTVATAASHTVRVNILTFIISMEDEFTELSLENIAGEYFDVPAEWNGHYYPSYIPSGFYLGEISQYSNSVLYVSLDDHILEFKEYDDGDYGNIDTEDGLTQSFLMNGSSAFSSQKNGVVNIAWSIDNHYFLLRFDGGFDEAKRIAENVFMID